MSRTAKITITLIVLLLVVIGGLWYFQKRKTSCPQDTQTCTDGTVVKRVEPSCNFSDCPQGATTTATTTASTTASTTCDIYGNCTGSSTPTIGTTTGSTTATYPSGALTERNDTRQNIRYSYYKKLTTTYIQPQSWPPTVTVLNGATLNCATQGYASNTQRIINGQAFCVGMNIEGAAGSSYTTYQYKTIKSGKTIVITSVLRAPTCENYNDPKQTDCRNERISFNPDDVVKPIVDTLRFTNQTNNGQGTTTSTTTVSGVSTNIQQNQLVTNPLQISGQAPSSWFFEAVFPIVLYDDRGTEVARTQARAQGDWTTPNPVNFTAALSFVSPATASGTVSFQKDNPSGLPQNAGRYDVPVRFR